MRAPHVMIDSHLVRDFYIWTLTVLCFGYVFLGSNADLVMHNVFYFSKVMEIWSCMDTVYFVALFPSGVSGLLGNERHGRLVVHGHGRSSLFIYKNMSVPHVIGNERHGSVAWHRQERCPLCLYRHMRVPHAM